MTDAYAQFRPGYPSAIADWIAARAGLVPGAVIADVGAGTGLSLQLGETAALEQRPEPVQNFLQHRPHSAAHTPAPPKGIPTSPIPPQPTIPGS